MNPSLGWWIGFIAFITVLLTVDLGLLNREARTVGVRKAAGWAFLWICIALLFNAGLCRGWLGLYPPEVRRQKAVEFLTGYLIEYSLSVDNLFVFVLLFQYFKLDSRHQRRVLFWGIFGALILRGGMIAAGTALIQRFEWILYFFGLFLLYTGGEMALSHEERKVEPERNPAVRLFRRFVPVTPDYVEDNFFVWNAGRLMATPLMVLLVCVEVTDLLFAVDSIPAIFAVTRDSFIVFTSNVFAILGLRSLYFLLARVIRLFHYLRYGLSLVLIFIGVKMLLAHTPWRIETLPSLLFIGAVLAVSVAASLLHGRKTK